MRAALLGALAAGGFPPVPVTASATVPIPLGAATVDVYNITSGADGAISGGAGGACRWATGLSVAGHTSIKCVTVGGGKGAMYITWDDDTVIDYTFGNLGGAGGSASGGGGGPASELGSGMDGASGELGQGGSIAATGSVLVDYLGRGGQGGAKSAAAEDGVAWGGGGGGGTVPGVGAPGGFLLLFK